MKKKKYDKDLAEKIVESFGFVMMILIMYLIAGFVSVGIFFAFMMTGVSLIESLMAAGMMSGLTFVLIYFSLTKLLQERKNRWQS